MSRQIAEQRVAPWKRFRETGGRAPTLLGLLFVILLFVVSRIGGGQIIPHRVGQRIERDIPARVSFQLTNPGETERRRENARRNSPNIYVLNTALLDGIRSQLNQLLTIAKENIDSYDAFTAAAARAGFVPNDAVFEELKAQVAESSEYARWVDSLLLSLSHQYVVSTVERTAPSAILRDPQGRERPVDFSILQPATNTRYVEQMASDLVWQFPEVLRPIVTNIIVRSIQVDPANRQFEPIHAYDANLTRQEIERRVATVPEVTIPYEANQSLVRAGRLTENDVQLLNQERQHYLQQLTSDPVLRREYLLAGLGTFTVLLTIVLGLGIYTLYYEPRVIRKFSRCFGLAALLLVMLLAARILTVRGWSEFVVTTVAMSAALVTILFGQRYALGVTGAQALLTSVITDGQLGSMMVMLATGWFCVFLLGEIRTRSKLISAGVAAALLAFLLTVGVGLIDGQDLREYLLPRAVLTGAGVLLVGFIVQGVLPAIEKVFGVATSMTLLEWCDASKPLLRRVAQEAPGTYSHSLLLSSLAESAAEAIGANGLLARVGALYHDIGKIHKPDYFTENQQARINRHDKLSPTMSLMIIRGHVKDGVEIARQYGLPRVLYPFILEHHGTTLVKYFLRVASEQQSSKAVGRHDREISESEFRYPGPKPRSRESAILMMCDGAEGAVRSLSEPSAARIESVVHKIVMDRLTDGQFDDCGITMSEIHRVEDALVKALRGLHHGRIAYPKEAEPVAPAQPEDQDETEALRTRAQADQEKEVAPQAPDDRQSRSEQTPAPATDQPGSIQEPKDAPTEPAPAKTD
ncbi:MAG: HDIG domain-containing protein [Phycisphaerales bacterium]|nr:MAG: HDIG domain-containing protein [Phycisphaerales bacterium]